MDLGLADAVAVVTGASRGIGFACAKRLFAEGCRVLLVARGEEGLRTAKAAMDPAGGRVATLATDVTTDDSAPAIVEAAVRAFGGLDIVVANAGGSAGSRVFDETTAADWEMTFRLNVVHATNLLRAAASLMEAGGRGSAIFIASVSGSAPQGPNSQYAAAKAALIHAARSLAWEYAPKRIRVNAVSPGSILFPGGGWERRQQNQPREFEAFAASEFPWGRLGSPEEVADVVAFLASPRSRWINALDLRVDGGQRRPSM